MSRQNAALALRMLVTSSETIEGLATPGRQRTRASVP